MAEFLSRLSQSEVHLLPRAKVPNWQEASPFILSGYRPESRSWMRSMASWTYLHNESGNIFSHLLPGLALAVSAGIVGLDLRSLDGALVAFHLATATLCLSLSAIYHTGMNHSAPVAHLCLQIDYGGIMALVLGSFISGLHFAFRCEPALIIACSTGTAIVLLSPWFRGPEWRTLRLSSCIATGFFALAPIGHAWYLWGSSYLVRIGVPYYILEGGFLLAGCYVFETQVPESIYPGRFDIWGQSHTLWHIFVVLSIVARMNGLQSAQDYNQRDALC